MDPSTRRRMRTAHANHGYHCTCGKVVFGNGGRWSHREMHRRRNDGHHYITSTAYEQRFGR